MYWAVHVHVLGAATDPWSHCLIVLVCRLAGLAERFELFVDRREVRRSRLWESVRARARAGACIFVRACVRAYLWLRTCVCVFVDRREVCRSRLVGQKDRQTDRETGWTDRQTDRFVDEIGRSDARVGPIDEQKWITKHGSPLHFQ
jgi:hypothetical protein